MTVLWKPVVQRVVAQMQNLQCQLKFVFWGIVLLFLFIQRDTSECLFSYACSLALGIPVLAGLVQRSNTLKIGISQIQISPENYPNNFGDPLTFNLRLTHQGDFWQSDQVGAAVSVHRPSVCGVSRIVATCRTSLAFFPASKLSVRKITLIGCSA